MSKIIRGLSRLSYNAEYIISAHGSGLVNIMWCNKDVKIIEIIPINNFSQPTSFNHYKKICNNFQLNYFNMYSTNYDNSILKFFKTLNRLSNNKLKKKYIGYQVALASNNIKVDSNKLSEILNYK